MGEKLKLLVLSAMVAGLFWSSAARAQGVTQTDGVSYALSLVDAGLDPANPANAAAATAVSNTTRYVRVQVAVSVPRSGNHMGVSVAASPARLMYRKHKGPETAFTGSIVLTRDAPYGTDGVTPSTSDFYPMPQSGATVNYTGVAARSATNRNGTAWANYVATGQAHDPARWESIYLSKQVFDLQTANFEATYPMIASLLKGEATYEWYAASSYGLGSFVRISDIQDHGRKMDFTDRRLWVSVSTPEDSARVDTASKTTLGSDFEWHLRTMPGTTALGTNGWGIYRGSIGSTFNGRAGAQLLNVQGATLTSYDDWPRIESPVYIDGIGSVTFEAMSAMTEVDSVQQVLVQWQPLDGASPWVSLGTFDLTGDYQSFTVAFPAEAAVSARFRIVRVTVFSATSAANMATVAVRKVRVRSAKPVADFGKPSFSPTYPTYRRYQADGTLDTTTPLSILYNATSAGSVQTRPRGYTATLSLRRRAEDDLTHQWRQVPVTVSNYSEATGSATLSASLTRSALLMNADGTNNTVEDAFFLKPDGTLQGVLPGVYDLGLDYQVLGSFLAGREVIDEREAESGFSTTYGVEVEGNNGVMTTVQKPAVLDYREQTTAEATAFLRVTYRSGTGTNSLPYTLKTLDIPMLPSPTVPNQWRVDVSKTLTVADDASAVYAWGYQDADPTLSPIFQLGYLSFKVGFTTATNAVTYWFGQRGASAAGVMPNSVSPVPAVTETLVYAQADESAAVPLPVALGTLPNSHLMVEVTFPEDPTSGNDMQVRLCGSFWQDFNNWYAPSENFTETDFRDNCQSVTADFDCQIGETTDGGYYVANGWIPDEGPLASETAFTERFETGRGDNRGLAFYMPDNTSIAATGFTQWGASNKAAEPKNLREDGDATNYNSRYMTFSEGVEVVLSRTPTRENGKYYPDSLIRLSAMSENITPQSGSTAEVSLNGVGTVSFTLGMSIPYNLEHCVRLLGTSDATMMDLQGYGLAAGVQFNRPSETCAPSGYSVSYYLENLFTSTRYELRVTQIAGFHDSNASVMPTDTLILELYKWSGSTATRLPIARTSGTVIDGGYDKISGTLSGKTFGLWVRGDGKLAVGMTSALASAVPQVQFISRDAVASTTSPYILALGSAECRPIFRQVTRLAAANNTYTPTAIASSTVALNEPSKPEWSGSVGSWTLAADSGSSAHIQISRRTPTAELAGKLSVKARRNGVNIFTKTVSTDVSSASFTVVMGKTDAELILAPADTECNLFLDNIYVSSWCGNDQNRNGDSNVPLYTNDGFFTDNGFAAVGAWIRPEDNAQLNVAAGDYNGRQCILLQRSRKNSSGSLGGEVTTDGITHTGDSQAIYMPYSETGYGAVSFKYRIPEYDEFGSGRELPSAYVMLQFLDSRISHTDFLSQTYSGWKNVSAPVELKNTGGAWAMTSIMPKLADGTELVSTRGTLRLVMVTSGFEADDDPYVYIDNLRVSDNASGTVASWAGKNIKLTSAPVNQLYWKDRQALESASPAEELFAEKSQLTQAVQFNNAMSGSDVDGTFSTTLLNSPLLENGVGRVTFAARLVDAQPQPVRLYLCATTSTDEADSAIFTPVTYVEVTNTVYNVYDVDLSKFAFYKTKPNDDLSPGDTAPGAEAFSSSQIKRIRLQAYVEGDGVGSDGFGAPGESRQPTYGRILMDHLSVIDPIRPSLSVDSVAFSNVSGTNNAAEFDRNSPLSQPISGAPALRTMVALSHAQLLKDESIRVFITLDPQDFASISSSSLLARYSNDTYTYATVLGESATFTSDNNYPIIAWNKTRVAEWPLSAWFNLENHLNAVKDQLPTAPAKVLSLAELQALGLQNTIELERAGTTYNFFGDLTALGLNTLAPNSLVRYTAWAVYQSAESDDWFATQIDPGTYTDFPWYFPRSLNAEIQALADKAGLTATMFSPYYWVYSCAPGEVFINEFNLLDSANVNQSRFVELCAPAGIDIGHWQVRSTARGTFSFADNYGIFTVPEATTLLLPSSGAVPMQRKTDTSAVRSFYTSAVSGSAFFHREGGTGDATTDFTAVASTKNGGVFAKDLDIPSLGQNSGYAASLMLFRPTGGAEHIICFSELSSANLNDTASKNVDELYEKFRASMVSNGFAGEWYQTFLDGDWNTYGTTVTDAFGSMALMESGLTLPQAHGRRLTKANFFPANLSADNRFSRTASSFAPVKDKEDTSYATSIATVDMGGIWVVRKNAIETTEANGPLDLTSLCYGDWPAGQNPTEVPRLNEPATGVASGATQPYTQVTPRQINPDQFLVKYRELSQSAVVSSLEGVPYGTHALDVYSADNAALVSESRRGGRNTPVTWSIPAATPKVGLTYTPFPFHKIESISLRLLDAKTGDAELDIAKIVPQIVNGGTLIASTAADAEGWVEMNLAGVTAGDAFTFLAVLKKAAAADDDDRYNVEAKATFAFNEDSAWRKVITHVQPYTGATLGANQPWWGSSFGFDISYDEAILGEAKLSSFIVTYPSPAGLAALGDTWPGLEAPWAGLQALSDGAGGIASASLQGMEYADAITALKGPFAQYGKARYVELKDLASGRALSASAIGILSDAYATAMGYDPANSATWSKKEPAIPFCVWGVYSYVVQSDGGNETVSFLLPQAATDERPDLFTYPAWYQPLADRNAGATRPTRPAPYFYLYSTPPQAAWLSELNLVAGPSGSAPYAEVVMPFLRDGILNANPNVPQTTTAGWKLARYDATGATAGSADVGAYNEATRSYAHVFCDVPGFGTLATNALAAYVLHRPCGAAEGGVWAQVDANGGASVAAPTTVANNAWLLSTEAYVVPGKTDATDVDGSVQLVGQTVGVNGILCVTSAVADRTEWAFSEETPNRSNAANGQTISPDRDPEWNRVTVTSSVRNTVYGGVLCGYQQFGFFESEALSGSPSSAGEISQSLSGTDWVYNKTLGQRLVLSFRPRTNYRFERLILPPSLIGHVMLIGADRALTQETVDNEVDRLRALGDDARYTSWIQMGTADSTGSFRAEVEYTTVTAEDGSTSREPTGVITFNPDYIVPTAGGTEEMTFGDQDAFVITLVFADEPASAINAIQMEIGQGDVLSGAWLVTQTLYALDGTGAPDASKGGDTLTKPIWSDADGNEDGDYANLHGWLHQPQVGDKLGMSAVINPELGLLGGSLGTTVDAVRGNLEADASLRPFLVWTLIPKSKLPARLSEIVPAEAALRDTFLNNWDLGASGWLGSTPSIGDGIAPVGLRDLRSRLLRGANGRAFYSAAGIIPMTYRGYCDENHHLATNTATNPRAADTLLAFSTMTADELAEALGARAADTGLSDADDLLPYSTLIDMDATAEETWQEGAVLRFAIVIADAKLDRVYEVQSISNFSSDAATAYCPWYLPNAKANINAITTSYSKGISPYAWVYGIGRGGVWINEFRPFPLANLPTAFELAGYASPFTQDSSTNEYVPQYSLDGWSVVLKYAPMPLVGEAQETPLSWVEDHRVNLQSWVPYRRINSAGDPDTGYYDLDYYLAAEKIDSSFGSAIANSLQQNPYSPDTVNSFTWFKFDDPLFALEREDELRANDLYKNGIVYAIALERANGVVEDEVLFYYSRENLVVSEMSARMNLAIASENANATAASEVRGLPYSSFKEEVSGNPNATAQFFYHTTMNGGTFYWDVDLSGVGSHTLPGANVYNLRGEIIQPRSSYQLQTTITSTLSARVLGGDASLRLYRDGAAYAEQSGQTLSASYVNGTDYTIALTDWNREWFSRASVTKNGTPIDAPIVPAMTYSADGGRLAATTSNDLTLDADTLNADTDYVVTFTYTPEAAQLVAAGDLNAQDEGFLDWLLQVAPNAILEQSARDGVTASEKYWLGLDSAAVSAADVALDITSLGTHTEPDGSALPALSVALHKGDQPVGELRGDGVLVLLGKPALADEWQFLRRLYPEDVSGDSHLILRTDCTFFKAILLSAEDAAAAAQ